MKFTDTHCHLQFDKLAGDIDRVIADAAAAGVERIICVGTTLADSRQAVEIAQKYDRIWAAVGVHPHDGVAAVHKLPQLQRELANLMAAPKVVAMGEIGLDLFKNYVDMNTQVKLLSAQLEVASDFDKPFIFHVRDAFREFWPLIDRIANLRGVAHSFSATSTELQQILERGLYVGLNGIMTFTRDQAQLEAARHVPLEKLLIETDAPFLTPLPFRGKICEPKHVAVTAAFLAHLREEPLTEFVAATNRNASKLFSL